MSATNLVDNNRRAHLVKVLAKSSKKNKEKKSTNSESEKTRTKSLSQHYAVIRKDILKLKNDLALGYDLVRGWIKDQRFKKRAQ